MKKYDEYEEKDFNSNYQEPKKKVELKETFEVVLVGKNFLILKNEDGNNLRLKHSFSNLYSIGEKIYKENGKFLWVRD